MRRFPKGLKFGEDSDKMMFCPHCNRKTYHRFRPSPDAGPYWRCGECGNPTEEADE